MTELISNYLAVNVICTFALIILVHAAWHNVLLINEMKRQFALAALITIIVIVSELVSIIFENIYLTGRGPIVIANTIGFSLSPFIAIALSKAFSIGKGNIRLVLTIPVLINFILVVSSPWTGLIFNVNPDINYLRGPLFGVYIVAYLCSYVLLIIDSIKAMKYYQCLTKSTFIMLLIFTIIGTTVQLIHPSVHASWLCVTLSLVLFYAYFCVLTETQDTLTGLLNRNVYDHYTKNLYHNVIGMVIVFDLDGFKQINDQYGHQWGDFCLQMLGSLIKEYFCKMGYCYRIGGDEFCVICETTNVNQVNDALKLFHEKIDEIRKSNNLQYELPMVSTGYSIFDGSAKEFDIAVRNADALMYSYKNNRKRNQGIL